MQRIGVYPGTFDPFTNGHLDLADFLLIVPAESLTGLTEKIRSRLEQSLEYFYPIGDRDQISSNPRRLLVKTTTMPAGAAGTDLAALKAELLSRKA